MQIQPTQGYASEAEGYLHLLCLTTPIVFQQLRLTKLTWCYWSTALTFLTSEARLLSVILGS